MTEPGECVGGPLDGRIVMSTMPARAPRFRWSTGAYVRRDDDRWRWIERPADDDENVGPWVTLGYSLPP